MAKAASPIRLQEDLMQSAALTAPRYHRSTAEQIEYWADIGRCVSAMLDPDTLLSVISGLTTIKTEPVSSEPIPPSMVFSSLEDDRKSGELPTKVTSATVAYQISLKHPGYLEKVDADGHITVGQFKNGQFIAKNE